MAATATAAAAPLAFRIQEFGHAQLLLRHVKGVLEVVSGVGLLQSVVIHQIGPEIKGGGQGQRFNGGKKNQTKKQQDGGGKRRKTDERQTSVYSPSCFFLSRVPSVLTGVCV